MEETPCCQVLAVLGGLTWLENKWRPIGPIFAEDNYSKKANLSEE